MSKASAHLKPGRKFGSLMRVLRIAAEEGPLPKDTRETSEMLLARAESTLENFMALVDAQNLACCKTGLSITLHVNSDERKIAFSLDNLSKKEVIDHLKEGKLFEEVMTLYRLAHLPGTESFTMNIALPGQSFDIIDRVYLNLEETFHPYRKKKSVALLDVLASHLPYDKTANIESGIRWLQEKKSAGIPG